MRSKKEIYKAIAAECMAVSDDSKRYILSAYASYCVALKNHGVDVPLWTEAAAIKGVHREIKKYKEAMSAALSAR